MGSSLTWIDHDSAAREKTLRILSLFQERESRDELGLGSVRDSFADQLFPGTSTIQTRLRYMLIVPWVYQTLENKGISSNRFAKEAENLERSIIDVLRTAEDSEGTIGSRAGKDVVRLPSSIYWAGLGVWGIRLTPFSQAEYHNRIDETYRKRINLKNREKAAKEREDDIDIEYRKAQLTWHPRLPVSPSDFPSLLDFSLTREEAGFIRDRIRHACPKSLLSFLSMQCKPADTESPWEHPDYAIFSDQHKELLTHARLFSEVMHGAALSYNFQLAGLQRNTDRVKQYKAMFDEWVAQLPVDEIQNWSMNRLWELTTGHGHTITYKAKAFIESWVNLVRTSQKELLSNESTLDLIKKRETDLKGVRSRFKNQRALEQWGGSSGVDRLTFRWSNVQVLLRDLYNGLNRGGQC